MKTIKFRTSIKYLATLGFVALLILQLWVPPPSAESFIEYALLFAAEYLLILSGAVSAAAIFMSLMSAELMFSAICLGLICLSGWVYLFTRDRNQPWELFIPITAWVSIGTWGAFMGLSAGV